MNAGTGAGELARRSVGSLGVVGQSLAIGPIFSAGFLSGAVAVYAGFNTPLAVLLAAVGTMALAYVLTLYGRRFAGAGAVYEYLVRGTHSSLGIVGAGTYLIGLLFLGAGGGFVAEGYLISRLLSSQVSIDLGWGPWALASLGAVIAINYVGVRLGIRVILATAALSAIPFVAIAIAIIARGGAGGNSLAVFDPAQTSWSAVFHGVLFAVSLFIGFETVAALGEEARLPRRSIPMAMITSIVLCAGFYLLVMYAGAIGYGRTALAHNAWFVSGNPFGDLGDRYFAHGLGWIVNLTLVLDLFSVCVAFTLAASRVLMTLARDGLMPAALSRTSSRFHTPIGGLSVIAGWALAVIGWAALADYGPGVHGSSVLPALLILLATGSYLITLVYLMLAGGCLWLLRWDRGHRSWWRIPIVLVAIAVPILSLVGSLNPFPPYPNNIAVYFAGASLLIAFAWYLALRARKPAAVSTAARHAEHDGLPPDRRAARVEG
ncbi:MAG: APC family permease [Solirubrobacteraceae bacterium]